VISIVFSWEILVGRFEGERNGVAEAIWPELCLETALFCLDWEGAFLSVGGMEEGSGCLVSGL